MSLDGGMPSNRRHAGKSVAMLMLVRGMLMVVVMEAVSSCDDTSAAGGGGGKHLQLRSAAVNGLVLK